MSGPSRPPPPPPRLLPRTWVVAAAERTALSAAALSPCLLGFVFGVWITSLCTPTSFPALSLPACLPLQYKLNDRTVTWEQYNRKLEQYNILVKARNFLVFQVGAAPGCCHWMQPGAGCWVPAAAGPLLPAPPPPPHRTAASYRRLHRAVLQGDIENVAQMQPRDLTALFEAISGSGAYRQQYEELEKKKAEAEEAVTYIFSKKKAIAQGGWRVWVCGCVGGRGRIGWGFARSRALPLASAHLACPPACTSARLQRRSRRRSRRRRRSGRSACRPTSTSAGACTSAGR